MSMDKFKMGSTELSDYDIHCIMESLQTRNAEVVAECALGIEVLLQELQRQLLILLAKEKSPVNCTVKKNRSYKSYNTGSATDSSGAENSEDDTAGTSKKHQTCVSAPEMVQIKLASASKTPISKKLNTKLIKCEVCSKQITKKQMKKHLATHVIEVPRSDPSSLQPVSQPSLNGTEEELVPLDLHIETPRSKDTPRNQDPQPLIENPNTKPVTSQYFPSNTVLPSEVQIDISTVDCLPQYLKGESPSVLRGKMKRVCPICGVQTQQQHMQRHMMKHTGEKPFSCPHCERRFSRKDKVADHVRRVHRLPFDTKALPKRKVYYCKYCEFSAPSVADLRAHEKASHPNELVNQLMGKMYKCDLCNHLASSPSHLAIHKTSHTGHKMFMCHICGIGYSAEHNLKRHVKRHNEAPPLHCRFCDKGYFRKEDLAIHERGHTGEKPYVCDVCGAQFRSSKHMKRHSKIHTGLKPHQCDICKRHFSRNENMRAHKKTHDKKTNKEPKKLNISEDNDTKQFKKLNISEDNGAEQLKEQNISEDNDASSAP